MSFDACEKLVRTGDHDRWCTARLAPPEGRRALMAIYAANLMIARAPWASAEPLPGLIRLQWWGDEIGRIYQGAEVTTHEIFPALAEVIRRHALPETLFAKLVAARGQDRAPEALATAPALESYIDATAGSVMELAALALGAKAQHLPPVRDLAHGAGLAAWLRAAPALIARGHTPLPDDVESLIRNARQRMAKARRHNLPRQLAPALLAGWRAKATLSRALKHPEYIAAGKLTDSPARKTTSLLLKRLTRRW